MEKRLPWVSRSPCITVVNFLVVQERPPSLTSVVSDWSVKAGRPFHYEFMKEDRANSSALGKDFIEQAKNLQPYSDICGSIGHEAFATLLDGLY